MYTTMTLTYHSPHYNFYLNIAAATATTAESSRLPESVAVQAVLGGLTTDVSGHVSLWRVT
jgi:hypothetical protein